MKLTEIRTLWEKDCKIDRSELDSESLNIPYLHSRYMNILTNERLVMERIVNEELPVLIHHKKEYYLGRLPDEILKKYDWPIFHYKIKIGDVMDYVNADKDVMACRSRISIQKEKVNFLSSIVDMIIKRTFHISNAIKYQKFLNGVDD